MAKNDNIDVLAMAEDYAQQLNIDPAEIFKQHPVSGITKAEAEAEEAEEEKTSADSKPVSKPKKKEEWRPDMFMILNIQWFNIILISWYIGSLEVLIDRYRESPKLRNSFPPTVVSVGFLLK